MTLHATNLVFFILAYISTAAMAVAGDYPLAMLAGACAILGGMGLGGFRALVHLLRSVFALRTALRGLQQLRAR